MHGFEGYVGVRLWEGQLVNDLIFSLLLVLLIVFAMVFHSNHHLFEKMVRDVIHVKDRLSLFEEVSGNEAVFRSFMIFQSLFLCSLSLFLTSRKMGYITDFPGLANNLKVIGSLFIILVAFYAFKQAMYLAIGAIFTAPGQYKNWKAGYTAVTGLWGVFLYLPVLWFSFIRTHAEVAIIVFAFLFIVWRLVILYKSIRIFNIKSIGILYIFLYLCGQEMLPLLFLYEGIKYLYNFY
jgi:hypothetical protein